MFAPFCPDFETVIQSPLAQVRYTFLLRSPGFVTLLAAFLLASSGVSVSDLLTGHQITGLLHCTSMMPSATDAEFDGALLQALRTGDEQAFAWVINEWSPGMFRLARCYVATDALAEDVVQEAWLAALRGLDGFEGRCRLRTWVLRIVANIAKSWGAREHRVTPFSSASFGEGPTVGPERFNPPGEPGGGAWRTLPASWPALPEREVLSAEALAVVQQALAGLPDAQRAVIALRDLDGYEASEVCEALGLTEGNQRVLLHRARAAVRQRVESYFTERQQRAGAGGQL
jgi:RNA polymerase sigma-70 factor, ECF subfamily